jgi:predicted enzyme related to lactoylglutathione lyase
MAGKVVHVEIGAADADRAQGFWSGVFGWEVGPPMSPEMDYRMFQTAEDQGGAIVGGQEPGALTVYFDTGDIDASMAKVRELGGEAGDKTPVPGHGWFAACRDTEGNAFSLWQGGESAA